MLPYSMSCFSCRFLKQSFRLPCVPFLWLWSVHSFLFALHKNMGFLFGFFCVWRQCTNIIWSNLIFVWSQVDLTVVDMLFPVVFWMDYAAEMFLYCYLCTRITSTVSAIKRLLLSNIRVIEYHVTMVWSCVSCHTVWVDSECGKFC